MRFFYLGIMRLISLAILFGLLFGIALPSSQAQTVNSLAPGETRSIQCAGERIYTSQVSAAEIGVFCQAPSPTATATPSPTEAPTPSPTDVPLTPTATVVPSPTATMQPTSAPEQLSNPVKLGAFINTPKSGNASTIAPGLTWHASDWGGDRLDFRKALNTAGYTGKHLTYVLLLESQNPSGVLYAPYPNQWSYKTGDWNYLNGQASWFLQKRNADGSFSRIAHGSGMYAMDPCSSGYRAWLYARAKQMQAEGKFPDGIALDNTPVTWSLELRKAGANVVYSGAKQALTNEQYVACAVDLVAGLRAALGPSIAIWGNMIEGRSTGADLNTYFTTGGLSGAWYEAWVSGWTQYGKPLAVREQNGDLDQVAWLLANGKGVHLTAQGLETDTQTQQFALASYLLIVPSGNVDQATFRFADVMRVSGYGYFFRYDNYGIRLGEPLGPRYAVAGGWARNFEGGRVRVDQVNRRGFIEVKTP